MISWLCVLRLRLTLRFAAFCLFGTIVLTPALGQDLTVTFENGTLTIEGGASSDDIVVTSRQGIVVINGAEVEGLSSSEVLDIMVDAGDGADTVDLGGVGEFGFPNLAGDIIINGGDGNDRIRGSEFDETINGGDGNDYIVGGEGDDTVRGGPGNDSLLGEGGNDVLSGQEGNDSLGGFDGDDLLRGGPGDDVLFGDHIFPGNDILEGGEGDDRLIAESGDDQVSGGPGNDHLAIGLEGVARHFLDGGEDLDLLQLLRSGVNPAEGIHIIKNFLGTNAPKTTHTETFDLVKFLPTCCTGSTLTAIETVQLSFGDGDSQFVIDDMTGTDLQHVQIEGHGGQDVAYIQGTPQDDVFTVSAGRTTVVNGLQVDVFGFEALSLEAFPSPQAVGFGEPDGNDTFHTVGLAGLQQILEGGTGTNDLVVETEGQPVDDTGLLLTVDGAEPIQYRAMGTVTIDPTGAPNTAPVATDDTVTLEEDGVVDFSVLPNDQDADGDALAVTATTQPPVGTLEVFDFGTMRYTPPADFNGTASFDYTLSDSRGGTAQATVTLTVNAVNDRPSPAAITDPAAGSAIVIGGDPETIVTISWADATDIDGDALYYRWALFAEGDGLQPLMEVDAGMDTEVAFTFGELAEALAFAAVDVNTEIALQHRVITTDSMNSTLGPLAALTVTRGTLTALHAAEELPSAFVLHGNYPNPFNPETAVVFDLPEAAHVRIAVIDALGRSVLERPAQVVSAGARRVLSLDASGLASGVYIYRVIAQTETHTMMQAGRMIVVK